MSTAPQSQLALAGESAPQIPDVTLDELLLPLPSGAGDRTALIDGVSGERWSHQEVRERALACAQDARDAGIEPGQRVLLALPNGVDFAAALLGLLAAGAVVSPVGHRSPACELSRRAEAIGARMLVSGSRDRLSCLGAGTVGALPDIDALGSPTGLALLPWSSGTTASPKPVAVTHRNAVAGLVQLAAAQPLGPDDVLLGMLPFCHLFGMQYVLNHALLSGASVVLLPHWDARAALDAVSEHGVTVLHAVPPMVHDLTVAAEQAVQDGTRPWQPGRLEQILSGGAPMSLETAERCERVLGVPVDGAYGLTEVNTCHFTRRGARRRPGSSGHPVPGTEYRLVAPGEPAHDVAGDWPDGTGELHLRGPQVASGYLGPDGRLVAITDSDGWLATGDLARVDADGCLYVVDRLKDVIKYNGHQISPTEVEAVLRTHPAVADAAVVPVPDRRAGQLPLACIVPAAGSRLTPELDAEIKEFAAARLAPHKKPRLLREVPRIERTASGKPLRRLLTPTAPRPGAARPLDPDLTGRTVLVTGGSRGLGRALAEAFLDHGARVTITGRDRTALERVHTELAPHGDLDTAAVDSTDHSALCDLADRLRVRWGGVDVLVANAGAPGPCGPAWENDPDHWWSTQQANVHGTFLTCHTFVPQLIERGGRIITVASRAGLHRWPHMSAYSVAKAAVIKFTENLAAELRPHGVRAFAYHPGLLTIGMATRQLDGRPEPGSWDERIQAWYLREHAAGRTTPTALSTRGALLLAAGAADHLSGQYLTPEHPALAPAGPPAGPPAG
ncbi:SDR family NAD(P)-dependent oxidoreductase [Streptomyces sp. R302]|uniref:SDR family NAD(P)-dependent oxidoreductase n=1 Tax=unclassified Streptomyces TaxID=2593676 RepID=UPI00145D4B33|nr:MULTISPECIES: SDR family NAD(P)-dependent oxidoreductase [unclassified Streptomyces]NML54818.1 SDR family NAD(P)-dependent oxidoreductase [Streptomyces sp. R301]NML84019.1 SDR family NAD(P)-dependent oxidoreductase [Streptomyces sp. R302]